MLYWLWEGIRRGGGEGGSFRPGGRGRFLSSCGGLSTKKKKKKTPVVHGRGGRGVLLGFSSMPTVEVKGRRDVPLCLGERRGLGD